MHEAPAAGTLRAPIDLIAQDGWEEPVSEEIEGALKSRGRAPNSDYSLTIQSLRFEAD